MKIDKFSFVFEALYMRFAFARFFLSCVNSFVHQIFEFSHDRFYDMNWFDASIITFFSNFVYSFRLFEVELINNRVIRSLILEWLFLKYWANLFQFAFWVLNFLVIELFIVSISSILIENSITSWSESISASSFIDQFVIFDARSDVANVKSMTELELSRVNVCSSDMLINSQLNLFNQSINTVARIDDAIREFHHWWWALKSSHTSEFFVSSIVFSFLSIVYSFELNFWHFSLYTFTTVKFSIFVLEMLNIWMFVFEHKFDRDVTVNLNDLDTKVIIFCLWTSSCSDKILLNVECEIVIWLSLIHDFCMHIIFIFFFKSYFRHDIIVFVDLAQLCCKNLIFRIVVLFMRW